MVTFDNELMREAKAIVALALRAAGADELTRGMPCPTCSGDGGFRHLEPAQLERVKKDATSEVFRLLWLRDNDAEGYQRAVRAAGGSI